MAKRQRRARLTGKPRSRSTPPRSTAAAPARSSDAAHPLLDTQRTAGNLAVSRLVQREATTAEEPTTHRKLRLGDVGDDVLLARAKLYASLGKPTGAQLGLFNDEVKAAVEEFQGKRGLEVDGVIGKQTWAALDAVAGDRAPEDEVTIAELRLQKVAADKLLDGGDTTGAELAYLTLYRRRDIPPIMRFGITAKLAECAHKTGRFDEAIGLYSEYMDLPGLDPTEKADALQRIRECRLQQPPGIRESEQSKNAKVDPEARAQGRKTVRLGDQGDTVAMAQSRLYVAIGEPSPKKLGTFDEDTEAAVRTFQGERNLGVDGEVGPQTWAALDAVAGDRVPEDEVQVEELRQKKKKAADALKTAGDFAAAEAAYKELYVLRVLTPIMRFGITSGLGHCVQAQGRFDEAILFYQEFLDLPGVASDERSDALQRIRECRLKQPPGIRDSEAAKAVDVDPDLVQLGAKTIKLGDTGDSVLLAQTKCYAAIAAPTGQSPGVFDAETEAAVKQFQSDRGLQVDGAVGPQTWSALDAVAGDRAPDDEVTVEELRQKKKGADALLAGGDFAGAQAEYEELYARRDVPPILRFGITFGLAGCAQGQGNFELAISLYREYLDLPGVADDERGDAMQRIRECRAKQGPGKRDSELAAAAVVPSVEPG